MPSGHGERLSRKQEQAIAALLEKPTVAEAATTIGINEKTLRGWLKDPVFAAAYRQTRREVLETSVGRLQAATATAVDTLVTAAKSGTNESDRVRATIALLDHAFKGFDPAAPAPNNRQEQPMEGTAGVVRVLTERLRQVDTAELPTAERARLTVSLADALLRAIGVDVLDKRLEALQAVLLRRKDQER
jgi:hypothetical protein